MTKPQPGKGELWRQRVAQQQSSGKTVRAWCREHELSECSFYFWRRQLGATATARKPLRFALVDIPTSSQPKPARPTNLELIFPTGERLLLPPNADTLNLVLNALRQPRSAS